MQKEDTQKGAVKWLIESQRDLFQKGKDTITVTAQNLAIMSQLPLGEEYDSQEDIESSLPNKLAPF